MRRFKAPCARCGELADTNLCSQCQKTNERQRIRDRKHTPKPTPSKRGYDHHWRNLSERARRLQPWCSMCGTKHNLTADHTPEAWERKKAGKPIRLKDIDVLCMDCNIKAGAARGNAVKRPYRQQSPLDEVAVPTRANRRSDGKIETLGGIPKPNSKRPRPLPNSQDELMTGFRSCGGGEWKGSYEAGG